MSLFDPGYYTEDDLQEAGFKSIGNNVSIAKNCTIVGLENIEIADNVRIDGYCQIIAADGGYIRIGSYCHIGGWSFLSGGGRIVLGDHCGLSQGARIYTRNDDYSGHYLAGPTVPKAYTGVTQGKVVLEHHVIIGSGSIILPNVVIAEGSCVGAASLVKKSLKGWGIYAGCPVSKD